MLYSCCGLASSTILVACLEDEARTSRVSTSTISGNDLTQSFTVTPWGHTPVLRRGTLRSFMAPSNRSIEKEYRSLDVQTISSTRKSRTNQQNEPTILFELDTHCFNQGRLCMLPSTLCCHPSQSHPGIKSVTLIGANFLSPLNLRRGRG